MSLYYPVGFVHEFVHVCETEFAIYLEKWEPQSTFNCFSLSPLLHLLCCCNLLVQCWNPWCTRIPAQPRAGWHLQMCAHRGRQQATVLTSASLFSNSEDIFKRGRENPLSCWKPSSDDQLFTTLLMLIWTLLGLLGLAASPLCIE